jgi:hypothetical protein
MTTQKNNNPVIQLQRHFQPERTINIFEFQQMAETAKVNQTGGLMVHLPLEWIERMPRVRKPFIIILN